MKNLYDRQLHRAQVAYDNQLPEFPEERDEYEEYAGEVIDDDIDPGYDGVLGEG